MHVSINKLITTIYRTPSLSPILPIVQSEDQQIHILLDRLIDALQID